MVTALGLVLAASTACGAGSTAGGNQGGVASDTALRYIKAVLVGNYTVAVPLVAPEQRGVLQAIALGAHKNPPAARSDVRVGGVKINGPLATVTFVGTMCRPGAKPHSQQCISNSDPGSSSPIFTVKLARERGKWYVIYQAPA